jgi:hypothetical protein
MKLFSCALIGRRTICLNMPKKLMKNNTDGETEVRGLPLKNLSKEHVKRNVLVTPTAHAMKKATKLGLNTCILIV